jgi:hypothetical protein
LEIKLHAVTEERRRREEEASDKIFRDKKCPIEADILSTSDNRIQISYTVKICFNIF